MAGVIGFEPKVDWIKPRGYCYQDLPGFSYPFKIVLIILMLLVSYLENHENCRQNCRQERKSSHAKKRLTFVFENKSRVPRNAILGKKLKSLLKSWEKPWKRAK